MKKLKTSLAFLFIIGFSSLAFGTDRILEEIPLDFLDNQRMAQLEGVERTLSPEQIKEILPWAENSQIYLEELLDEVQGLSKSEKESQLLFGIKSTILSSKPKNTELLMRYVLSRGVMLHEMLLKETNKKVAGSQNTRIRILEQSAYKALHYYESDLHLLQGKGGISETISFAYFGKEYAQFILEIAKSVFDASAEYGMIKLSLEFLQWDLYRDLERKVYAPQIRKIYTTLNSLSADGGFSDQKRIKKVRQMKKLFQKLGIVPGVEMDLSLDLESDRGLKLDFNQESGASQTQVTQSSRVVDEVQEISSPRVSLNEDQLKTDSNRPISQGTIVYTHHYNSYIGQVKRIFKIHGGNEKKVEIRPLLMNGANYEGNTNLYLPLNSSLYALVNCGKHICKDDLVYKEIDGFHYVGRVQRVFKSYGEDDWMSEVVWEQRNGVAYNADKRFTYFRVDESLLTQTWPKCQDRICIGTIVYTHHYNSYIGQVKQIFKIHGGNEKKVEIRPLLMNGANYEGSTNLYLPLNPLLYTLTDCGGHICKDDLVYYREIDGTHYIGRVQRVFKSHGEDDGMSEVVWEQRNGYPYNEDKGFTYFRVDHLSFLERKDKR